MGSVVVVHGLSCSTACGIFPDQGLNWCPALQGGFLTTGPPGKPQGSIFKGKVREGYGRICDQLEHNSVANGQVTGWYHVD